MHEEIHYWKVNTVNALAGTGVGVGYLKLVHRAILTSQGRILFDADGNPIFEKDITRDPVH